MPVGGVKKESFWELDEGFWEGKTSCWRMCHCPPMIKDECPATKYPTLPCWEIEGTWCKLKDTPEGLVGTDTSICRVCRVYKTYGHNSPIELKLFGKGIVSAWIRRGKTV